ncbi:Hypothetical predicted protein, partial [Prunus dulcis]
EVVAQTLSTATAATTLAVATAPPLVTESTHSMHAVALRLGPMTKNTYSTPATAPFRHLVAATTPQLH